MNLATLIEDARRRAAELNAEGAPSPPDFDNPDAACLSDAGLIGDLADAAELLQAEIGDRREAERQFHALERSARREAERQLADLARQVRNLLAVIHRDDGTYTETHGLSRSIEDARQRWGRMQTGLTEAAQCLEDAAACISNEILVRELSGRDPGIWPDLLDGRVSGGGIVKAMAAVRAAQTQENPAP